MIAFDLICSRGHKFECWFKSNVSFEERRFDGDIHCPVCDDTQVEKAISTFAIKKYGGRREETRKEEPTGLLSGPGRLFRHYGIREQEF